MNYQLRILYKIMTQIYCGVNFFFLKSCNLAQELIFEGALLCDIKHMKSSHHVIILFPPELIKL